MQTHSETIRGLALSARLSVAVSLKAKGFPDYAIPAALRYMRETMRVTVLTLITKRRLLGFVSTDQVMRFIDSLRSEPAFLHDLSGVVCLRARLADLYYPHEAGRQTDPETGVVGPEVVVDRDGIVWRVIPRPSGSIDGWDAVADIAF